MMKNITVVSLGPGDADLMTQGAMRALKAAKRVVLRTAQHGAAAWLQAEGIAYESLDALYADADDFDALCDKAAEAVLSMAAEGPICYGVPDPTTDGTVASLSTREELSIVPGVSQADTLRAKAQEAGIAPASRCAMVPASDLADHVLDPSMPLLITEMDNRLLAGEVKLKLLDLYPPDMDVYMPPHRVPLSSLDRQDAYSHLSCVYVPACEMESRTRYTFHDLIAIMARLRRPGDGCPWDTKQTHETLRQYMIEEAYEVVDAIQSGDDARIADELGDVLLQVVFNAQVAKEHGTFDIGDVSTAICHKMITRHAHIWGDVKCQTAEDVLTSWEAIKKKEKGLKKTSDTMRDIPAHLPALMRAYKVQNKARQVGFDWDAPEEALSKVIEEAGEVRRALQSGEGLEMELGDLLFAAANVVRLSGLQPELALSRAADKFVRRFEQMEAAIQRDDLSMGDLSLAQMDVYWEAVKKKETP